MPILLDNCSTLGLKVSHLPSLLISGSPFKQVPGYAPRVTPSWFRIIGLDSSILHERVLRLEGSQNTTVRFYGRLHRRKRLPSLLAYLTSSEGL